jgi:D-xylose transport system permease protein
MSENVSPIVPLEASPSTGQARSGTSRKNLAAQVFSSVLSGGTAMPAVVSMLVIAIFFNFQSRYFLTPDNLSNLAVQASLVATIALGEVVVLLLAEIDLSLGSLAGATAAILGVLMANWGMPWYVAVLLMLASGAALGAFQGLWIAYVGVPSFVVTLAGLLGFLGMQLYVLGPQGTLSIFDPQIGALTSTTLPPTIGWILGAAVVVAVVATAFLRGVRGGGWRSLAIPTLIAVVVFAGVAVFNASRGVPTAFLVLLALLTVGWWITERTRPGRHLFAVGGNPEAARRAGIPVRRIRFVAFTISGLLAAVGGLFAASYNASAGTLTGGGTLLLEAIGAAVIGGTSLFGGRGTVWSALVGSLIMGGVANGLDLSNADQPVKYMVQGAIVLLAVSLDTVLRRRQSRGRQLAGARA